MLAKLPWFVPARWRLSQKEPPCSLLLAPSSMISETDTLTRDFMFTRTLRLQGVPFDTADPQDVDEIHEIKAAYLGTLPGGEAGTSEHRIQRFSDEVLPAVPGDGYEAEFDCSLRVQLQATPFLRRENFLTVISIPPKGFRKLRWFGLGGLMQINPQELRRYFDHARRVLDEHEKAALTMLRDFKPQVLANVTRNGVVCSEPIEFMGMLHNGRWRPMRATREPLFRVLPLVRPSAHEGMVELHSVDGTRYAVMLDIQTYKDVEHGSLDGPLYERAEWVETISGLVLDKRTALERLKRQRGHLLSSEDPAEDQINDLEEARKGVADDRYRILNFHYGMAVFGNTPQEALDAASKVSGAVTRTTGMHMAQVDLLADAAWYAQQPGGFKWRPRVADVTSRAFAAMAATHGYFSGKRFGNPWGDPIIRLKSDSDQAYDLNLHETPVGEANEGQNWPGSVAIYGRTGVGKTTVETALLVQSRRWYPKPTLIVLDKDRSIEIALRALGGEYRQPQPGEPTGFNPFMYPLEGVPTEQQIAHWIELGIAMVHTKGLPLQPTELRNMEHGVRAMARMPSRLRCVDAIWQNLDIGGPQEDGNNIYDRLERWCSHGPLGWVFQTGCNALPPACAADILGLDYTQFLKMPVVRGPLLLALLHYFEEVIDHRQRIIVVLVEAWRALEEPAVAEFAKDQIKTIRKKGGLLMYDTQEPQDVLPSAVGPSLVSQTATYLLLPDPKARRKDYVDGFGLSEKQYEIVRSLHLGGGHKFLVVQGSHSVVCRFDLSDLPEHLLILSGNKDNVRLLDQIRAEVGDDPRDWIPVLRHRALGAKYQATLKRAV